MYFAVGFGYRYQAQWDASCEQTMGDVFINLVCSI